MRSFHGLPDTHFWQAESCILSLLPKGGSKGPFLGKVPCHQKIFGKGFSKPIERGIREDSV